MMMNYVWLFLVLIALVVGMVTQNIEKVTDAAFSGARTAVDIAIGLVGLMTLWLGFLKIAEQAGLIRLLARLIRPISRFLFPEIPHDHPAIGAMLLNISASWLGLGNAATPLGIKAMEELQILNPQKDTATDSMIMFLGLNTASITLIPITIMAVRAEFLSQNPAEIIGTTIFASLSATIAAIFAAKILSAKKGAAGDSAVGDKSEEVGKIRSKRSKTDVEWRGWIFLVLMIAVIVALVATGTSRSFSRILAPNLIRSILTTVSRWMIPLFMFVVLSIATVKKIRIYEVFIEGAKEGFQVAIRIIPFLVAILVAVSMLRGSGALALFVKILTPITDLIGMPAEVLPAALMRPLSGSGTLGILSDLLKTHGPDSFIGRLGSTIYGCTETTFYVIAVYFGAVQIKKTRHAVPVGLFADLVGVLAALFICRLTF